MTQMHENIVGIDAAIFMHPTVWKASGHVDNFSDPMIDNKDSKKRYRVDHLIENFADELKESGEGKKAEEILAAMDALLAKDDFAGLKNLIEEHKIKCSISKTCNWTDVRQCHKPGRVAPTAAPRAQKYRCRYWPVWTWPRPV